MSKSTKLIIIAITALFLATFSETVVDARAGTPCTKVGQVRKFGGVSYTCTAGKGKKARKTWRATGSTTATPIVTTAAWNCGSSFTNDQYPQFQLDRLPLKPVTQSVLTYLSTPSCTVDVTWTLSSNEKINASRELFVCWEVHSTWPDSFSLNVQCDYDNPYTNVKENSLINIFRDARPGVPYYGFMTAVVKGYVGNSTKPEWESPRHLVMFDIDQSVIPDSWSGTYSQLNNVTLP